MEERYTKELMESYLGKKINRLEIISYYTVERNRQKYFVCKCDCGKELNVRVANIVNNPQKSCGCYKYNLKNGFSRTRLYPIWKELIARCNNPKNKRYYVYGKKGIKVCKEWENDFLAFRKWAYENGYDENAPRGNCTIDRIDNDGDYTPENCRWVSYSRQQRNTKKTIIFEYKGVKKPLIDWCEELNLPYNTIRWRYSSWGNVDKVLTQPIRSTH
jgi:hypothetical protein